VTFVAVIMLGVVQIALLGQLIRLQRRLRRMIMAKLDDVNAKIDAIGSAVAELAREIGVLVSNGPGVVTQEQLDALDAKLSAVLDAAKAADPNP
jgi:hypothetical protein